MHNNYYKDFLLIRRLLSIDGIGPQKILNLKTKFASFEDIFGASAKQLQIAGGISNKLSQRILSNSIVSSNFNSAIEKELEYYSKNQIKIITLWDNEYPRLLKNIFSPPIILYYKGTLPDDSVLNLAVVGTRTPSDYGKIVAEKLSTQLCKKGVSITSGLARGIDTIAHKSAVKFGSPTYSIIGSGMDKIYPPENKTLFEKISESGAVITEFELGTKPDAQNFPRRNRIISGISNGTLVIETRRNGGALQTAHNALEQNREVFAVPGNIESQQSEGTNQLIKNGEAKLVQTVEDIFEEFSSFKTEKEFKKKQSDIELNFFEEQIISKMNNSSLHIDVIAKACDISTSECSVYLLELEFKGLIKQLPGKMFVKL